MIRLAEAQTKAEEVLRRVISEPALCIGRENIAEPEESPHRPIFEGAERQVYRTLHGYRNGWQGSLQAATPRVDETHNCVCRAVQFVLETCKQGLYGR